MNCAYSATFEQFLAGDPASILGELHKGALADGFSEQWNSQTAAWQEEIQTLRDTLSDLICPDSAMKTGFVCLEYEIARRGRRIDAVLIIKNIVLAVEFKSSANLRNADAWQVQEYALDLRDFHAASSGIPIVPILVTTAPEIVHSRRTQPELNIQEACIQEACIQEVIVCAANELAGIVRTVVRTARNIDSRVIDAAAWRNAPYKPSLTIIEAAERIFAGQQVREISHSTAENLTGTVDCIIETVRFAQSASKKVICFLTGVPGAGKTLAGLSAVHDPILRQDGRPAAVFLSGNGPLVRIIRAALVRDSKSRNCSTKDTERQVSTFIQNVHSFLGQHGLKPSSEVPPEHVVVFDEAQRAWNGEQMHLKKRGMQSEADLMLEVMARCDDWAVIVALVGFGQEINNGEAGLQEWGRALGRTPHTWSVLASPLVLDHCSESSMQLFEAGQIPSLTVNTEGRLHLATTIRSPRARMVSDWVQSILNRDCRLAESLFEDSNEFPLAHTRDLNQARSWLATQSGDLPYPGKCGLVASSGALRLRAYGIELSPGFRRGFPYEDWFLANPDDVRSASRLEVAASEFECQGLELDGVGVCWGGDLVFDVDSCDWLSGRFAGSRWLTVRNAVRRQFILNKYRVLLTRARKGMIIWIPPGSTRDETLDARQFDETAHFLSSCGIPEL